MKLACQEGMAPGASLEEKLDNLEKYGYEGIEFGGRGLWDRVDEVNRACAKSRVKASSICAGFSGCLLDTDPNERKKAMDDIKRLLSVAADINAVGLIMVPIFGGPRVPNLQPYKSAVEIEKELLTVLMDDLGQHAARAGSILLLEPLNRYETHLVRSLKDGVEVCERVGNPNVKIMADFFHMSLEERNTAESIVNAGKWIAHVHLADSTRQLPGYGHTDWRAGFNALNEIGFQGYMALECGIPGDAKEELPKSAAFMRQQMG